MLTDATIRNAKPKEKPYKLTDSHGLYIEIRPTGSKLWRFRYRIAGKENVFALGEYPSKAIPPAESDANRETRVALRMFTLSEARVEQLNARGLVKQGIHPAQHRKMAQFRRRHLNGNTLAAVTNAWMDDMGKEWAPKYRYNIEHCFAKDVLPFLGDVPVSHIKPAHLLDVLDRIKARSPSMAKVTKMWLSAIFRFATVRQLVTDDPTYPLKGVVKVPKTKHHRPLEAKRLGTFLRRLDGDPCYPPTRVAARLLWLTLVRTNELLKATWDEFDLEVGLWRIPGPRMKMGEDHVVPLSGQALKVLASLHAARTPSSPYVFHREDDPRKPLGYAAIRNLFQRATKPINLDDKFTPHGIRSTFSTLANDAGIRPDVIERALAHQEQNKSRRAYNRSTLLPERRDALQRWANDLDAFYSDRPPATFGRPHDEGNQARPPTE